jgi:hypothetical protein
VPTYRGYWEALQAWTLSDASQAQERSQRLQAHRAQMDRVTAKMVL